MIDGTHNGIQEARGIDNLSFVSWYILHIMVIIKPNALILKSLNADMCFRAQQTESLVPLASVQHSSFSYTIPPGPLLW